MSQNTCISRRGALASASLVAASTAMLAAGRAFGEEFAEATPLSPNDAISFLYIDNAQLEGRRRAKRRRVALSAGGRVCGRFDCSG